MDEFLTAKTAKLLRQDKNMRVKVQVMQRFQIASREFQTEQGTRPQLTSTYSDTALYITLTFDNRHITLGRQPYTDSVIFIGVSAPNPFTPTTTRLGAYNTCLATR